MVAGSAKFRLESARVWVNSTRIHEVGDGSSKFASGSTKLRGRIDLRSIGLPKFGVKFEWGWSRANLSLPLSRAFTTRRRVCASVSMSHHARARMLARALINSLIQHVRRRLRSGLTATRPRPSPAAWPRARPRSPPTVRGATRPSAQGQAATCRAAYRSLGSQIWGRASRVRDRVGSVWGRPVLGLKPICGRAGVDLEVDSGSMRGQSGFDLESVVHQSRVK